VLRTTMSLVQGEAFLDQDEGAVFSDYYVRFRGSPWLRRLFMLEVIRPSSISRQHFGSEKRLTPLLCVEGVRGVEILDGSPRNRRLRLKLDLVLSEVGPWSGEIP